MVLQVFRNIHPIGQGAFYTETLHRPNSNDDKHIVYDCGVLPYSRRLEEEIGNSLPNDSTIDILFLSHFHADHVNGVQLLAKKYRIRHVVLPQIDDYEWFYILENYLTTNDVNVALISNIRAAVGDANLVQVAPIGENGEGTVSNENTAIDGLANRVINGLSPIVVDNKDFVLWHFIVVNPLLKGNIEALKAEIQNVNYNGRKLSIEDMHNPNILPVVRKDLQAVYSKVFKGGNEYSMCMLSELADRYQYESFSTFNRIKCHNDFCCRYGYCLEDCNNYRIDGGLYCGDADFLHCDTLHCLKKRLDGRERNVGLLQLPHHGSKENFNIDLLNWLRSLRVSFACFGNPNRYNHPSSDVMGIAGSYSYVMGVNQYKSNILTERIDVRKKIHH